MYLQIVVDHIVKKYFTVNSTQPII